MTQPLRPWQQRPRKAGAHTEWWFKPFLFGIGFFLVCAALAAEGFTSGEMTLMIYLSAPCLLVFAALVAVIHRSGRVAAQQQSVQVRPPISPGWYPDQAGIVRWHDGHQWTPYTRQGTR